MGRTEDSTRTRIPELYDEAPSAAFLASLPPYDPDTWKLLYRAYREVMPKKTKEADADVKMENNGSDDRQNKNQDDYDSDDSDDEHSTNDDWNEDNLGGYLVPIEIKSTADGKGRGIFCTAAVRKGDEIVTGFYATFYTEGQWRKFLSLLPLPLALNATEWAYVYEDDDDDNKNETKNLIVGLDIHEGSLTNHGDTEGELDDKGVPVEPLFKGSNDKSPPKYANIVECVEDEDLYVANRDIEAGEEFLCDYRKFHLYGHTLDWFEDTWDELRKEDFDGSDMHAILTPSSSS